MQFLFQMQKIKANVEIWNDYNVLRPGKHLNLIFRVIGPVFFDGGGTQGGVILMQWQRRALKPSPPLKKVLLAWVAPRRVVVTVPDVSS